MNNTNYRAFFDLLKAGLWENGVQLAFPNDLDFASVLKIAEEQSVVGLIAAGIEHISDRQISKEDILQVVGQALQLEQRNKEMNAFVGNMIENLRRDGIYALLVKGQGIAQCYERPLWRSSGDIDLLLSPENYQKAKIFLSTLSTKIDNEDIKFRHMSMDIDGWEVELHGSLRTGLWKSLDRGIDVVLEDVFYGGNVRTWMNVKTQVFLPRADEDIILVFSHILQHFFREGVGLRQICDWCRLLWKYGDSIDNRLLENRLKSMNILFEWKAFAAIAVNYLGMQEESIPFYSAKRKWGMKADKIMAFVLETGNFGHNRDYSYYKKYPYLVFKMISFWRHLKDGFKYFQVFPLDSIKVTWRKFVVGISVSLQGKRHE